MDGPERQEPTLESALGNVAQGARFWDRETEVRDLRSYLTSGTSLLLVGPRRIGKTSVLRRVLESSDTPHVFVDAQAAMSPQEFLAEMVVVAAQQAPLRDRLQDRFKRVFDRIEGFELATLKIEFTAELASSWLDRSKDVLRVLADGNGTIVAIDELPILFDRLLRTDPPAVSGLLSLLRWGVDSLGLRVAVSGSIGLEPVLHRAGLAGQATFLHRYELGPWDESTTSAAVAALARGRGLEMSREATKAVHAVLGSGVPYHVQLFADAIRLDADRRGTTTVDAHDVRRVYKERLLGSVSAHMLHLESRLKDVLGEGEELQLAFDLLTETAVERVLTTRAARLLADDVVQDAPRRAELLRNVLLVLEHDAYLHVAAQEYRFTSRLVQDWWRERNSFGYVPASERRQP